ncbi:MAG: hypothetical protein JXB39_05455 [Deltaproteobacteria bacterium]|nr:hypothetical protein [Deltaproteobacteria bacterium]
MDRRRLLWVALPFLLAGECGPTPEEAGTAALIAILPVLLVEALALVGLLALWRRVRPGPVFRVPWRAWALLLAAHLLAFLSALPAGALEGGWAYAGLAVQAVGSTHAAVLLVAWRIALAVRPARAAVAAPVAASLLVLFPALLMVWGLLGEAASGRVIDLWWDVGASGWTPAVLVGILLAEVGIRAGRDTLAARR